VAIAVPNPPANVAPAAADASATSAAIGTPSKSRVPVALLRGGDQSLQGAQVADGAAAAKSAPTASTVAGTTSELSGSPNTAGGPAVDPSAQKAPPRAESAATPQLDANNQSGAPVTAPANVQATTDVVATRSDAPTTVTQADDGGSANTSTANATVKAASNSLPSLGVAAANAATAQTTTATPAAAPAAAAAAVPIAGLPVVIAARAQAGSSQFDIRLDPPELGRIDVRLDVDSNGQVTSHVTADRPETLTLLQSQQPQLERALAQAGLKTADNGLQFSLRDQSFSGQNSAGGGGGNSSSGQQSAPQLVIPDSDLAPVDASQIYSRIARGGGIDIRV